jgi:hypothetical protein
MEVITGYLLNKKFKNIKEYKIDLGLAAKIEESRNNKGDYKGNNWVIKDKTIKLYYENFGRYLNRTGKIGTLLFYVDNNIKDNDIYILHNSKIFKSEYDKSEIRLFLSNLIKGILEEKIKPYEKINDKEIEIPDLKNMSNDELAIYLSKNRNP